MLSRYKDFSTDLLLEKAINESFIYYTKAFKDNLTDLRDLKNSQIAIDLLGVEHTNVKPDMTFISLADNLDDDANLGDIKFTQFKKVVSLIKKGLENNYGTEQAERLGDTIEQKLLSGNISDKDVLHFFTDPSYEVSTKSRNTTGIGRLVNQIFPGKFKSTEVEDFVNDFKNLNKLFEFELVSGEDIRKYYLYSNYTEDKGELGNSCMKKPECQSYLDIYVENPEIVRLLIYKDGNDEILGRALIWKLNAYNDLDNKAPYFMDRVYAIDDATKKLFKDFAVTQKWAFRTSSTYHRTKEVTFLGDEKDSISLEIQLSKWEFSEYPYMDTFKRLDPKDGILYNDESDDEPGWILTSTSGRYEDNNGLWSDWLDARIPEDQAVFSVPLDTNLLRVDSVEVTLGRSRYRGWYPEGHDDIVYDEFREEWICDSDSTWSEFLDKPFYSEDEEYIITWVDDDIYSYSYNKFRGDNEVVSDQWANYETQPAKNMDCYSYLEHNDEMYRIYNEIIDKNENGEYYFKDLKVKVYETEDGLLSEEDCEFLGVEPSGKSYTTDELAYLFRNPNVERILEACKEKLNTLENTLSGKQSRLKFEDDEDYINKVQQKIRKLNWRIEILEDWID